MKLNYLPALTFRRGRQYQLLETNSIAHSVPPALSRLLSSPEVFGMFVPCDSQSNLGLKIAYKDVALLYYYLDTEGKLPSFILNIYDDDINTTLARLVLDGVLEVEVNGQFVSGNAAQNALYLEEPANQPTESRLSSISKKAIRYVLSLNNLDMRSIAQRLYCYNTMPTIDAAYTDLSDSLAVEKYLQIATLTRKGYLRNWKKQSPTEEFNWISWFGQNRVNSAYHHSRPTYKMYISPAIDALPDTFLQFVEVLPNIPAFSFKIGADRAGLLRPDKLMIYFNDYDDLQAAANILKASLHADKVQGVPFTCAIDDAGLISWGIDPPKTEVLKDIEAGSWRAEVTDKISIAVAQAQAESISKNDAISFIWKKIALSGIDPDTWMPINYSPW